MNADESAWRLRQQALQIERLVADGGPNDRAQLEAVHALSERLDRHSVLSAQAGLLARDITRRSANGFDELEREQIAVETIERAVHTVFERVSQSSQVEAAAAAASVTILDLLQSLHDAD